MPVFLLTILKSIGSGIAAAWNWFWFRATWKLKIVILGTIAALVVAGYILFLRSKVSNLEEEKQQIELNRDLENVNRIQEDANRSEANFNAATEEANRIRNANFANTSLSEAEKARCAAYPESRGCKK